MKRSFSALFALALALGGMCVSVAAQTPPADGERKSVV